MLALLTLDSRDLANEVSDATFSEDDDLANAVNDDATTFSEGNAVPEIMSVENIEDNKVRYLANEDDSTTFSEDDLTTTFGNFRGANIIPPELRNIGPEIMEVKQIFLEDNRVRFVFQYRCWWEYKEIKQDEQPQVAKLLEDGAWRGLFTNSPVNHFPRDGLVGKVFSMRFLDVTLHNGDFMVHVEVETVAGLEWLNEYPDSWRLAREFCRKKKNWSDVCCTIEYRGSCGDLQ